MPIALRERLCLDIIAQLARQVKKEPDLRTSRVHGSLALTDPTLGTSPPETPMRKYLKSRPWKARSAPQRP